MASEESYIKIIVDLGTLHFSDYNRNEHRPTVFSMEIEITTEMKKFSLSDAPPPLCFH